MSAHDEPFSPTASLAIAKINHSLGVQGTFFFDPSNEFYDLENDEAVQAVIVEIQSLGQDIALKIDPKDKSGNFLVGEALEEKAKIDKEKFMDVTGAEPIVYSLDVTGMGEAGIEIPKEKLAGMVGSYSHSFSDGVERTYNGNSNGMHLFGKSFADVMGEGDEHIHLLVHPCWISEEPKLPYARLQDLPEIKDKPVLLQKFIDLVHKSDRVIAGDGNNSIDNLFTKVMKTLAPVGGLVPEPQNRYS